MDFPSYIDYTLLKADATFAEIDQLCKIAIQERYYAVCIAPYFVQRAHHLLKTTSIKVASVVGFPFGYNLTETKLQECRQVIAAGATEVDCVINLSALKSGEWNYIENEIHQLQEVINNNQEPKIILKIIIESGVLNYAEIEAVAKICQNAKVNFVKTSTGYFNPGAEIEKVRLLRQVLPSNISIKASGGIRTVEQAKTFILAGASRIGTSARLSEEK